MDSRLEKTLNTKKDNGYKKEWNWNYYGNLRKKIYNKKSDIYQNINILQIFTKITDV